MRIIVVRCARKRRAAKEKEVNEMPILQYKCKNAENASKSL